MLFTKEERVKIGNNVKVIRLGFGCDTEKEFVERLGKRYGLKPFSESIIRQIEKGTYKSLKKEMIQKISAYSMFFTYNDIVEGNLNEMVKYGDLVGKNVFSVATKIGLFEYNVNLLKLYFPFIDSNEPRTFSKAYRKAVYVSEYWNSDEKEKQVTKKFIDMFLFFEELATEKQHVEACFNFLSAAGYLFIFWVFALYTKIGQRYFRDEKGEDILLASSMYQRSKQAIDKKEALKHKKEFLDEFEDSIEECISTLSSTEIYSDFANYYIAIRYLIGMMDNEKVKYTDFEMERYGMSLLENLKKAGNKYANALFTVPK